MSLGDYKRLLVFYPLFFFFFFFLLISLDDSLSYQSQTVEKQRFKAFKCVGLSSYAVTAEVSSLMLRS